MLLVLCGCHELVWWMLLYSHSMNYIIVVVMIMNDLLKIEGCWDSTVWLLVLSLQEAKSASLYVYNYAGTCMVCIVIVHCFCTAHTCTWLYMAKSYCAHTCICRKVSSSVPHSVNMWWQYCEGAGSCTLYSCIQSIV